jgi:hypothetical protein
MDNFRGFRRIVEEGLDMTMTFRVEVYAFSKTDIGNLLLANVTLYIDQCRPRMAMLKTPSGAFSFGWAPRAEGNGNVVAESSSSGKQRVGLS